MWISVDIEADGPCPGIYSMIELGAVVVDPQGKFDNTFYASFRPMTEAFNQESLRAIGTSRYETLNYDDPKDSTWRFCTWVDSIVKPRFLSDNNGFDWQFVSFSTTKVGSLRK